ncbi:MAG: hypothetical protein EZS28_003000 [Streblomastix strix]|uniref:Reverse transcriptase domain-containing protein n=1 Tax=Streblomastix strix TaxID=222440 RepID=A0A5J4X402_9EUKA|nr:MAG: hypothetical protein EZS28_003000 [Streblomastix strix]
MDLIKSVVRKIARVTKSRTWSQLCLSRNYETFTRIEDDFMEEKGCEVYVGEQTGEVQVRFRGLVKAVVKEQGLFRAHNNERQDAQYWEFQSEEELRLWVACILTDAASVKNERLQTTIRASHAKIRTFRDTEPEHAIPTELQQMRPVMRKREDEERIAQASNSLQAQFLQQRLQYAKFNSIEDQMVAYDLTSTFEGILRQEAGKLDALHYQMQQSRDKSKAPPALPEEGPGNARMTLEATSTVTQGLAGIIHQIAGGDTQELVDRIYKVFKASLLSVGDAQRERESRIRGFQSGATAEDILSRQSKEKFKKSAKTTFINQGQSLNKQITEAKYIRSQSLFSKYEAVCRESLAFDPAVDRNEVMRRDSLILDSTIDRNETVCRVPLAFDPAIELNKDEKEVNNERTSDLTTENLNMLEQNIVDSLNNQNIQNQDVERNIYHDKTRNLFQSIPVGILIKNKMEQENKQWEINGKEELDITDTNRSKKMHKFLLKNLMIRCQKDNNIPIGDRMANYIEEWKQINVDQMIMSGIKAYWKIIASLQILSQNCRIPTKHRSMECETALSLLVQQELKEQIIEEVQLKDLKWINPCIAIPKQEKGKWHKITDCRILNSQLCTKHFVMEDMHTLTEMLKYEDWMLKIDLESAFHHIIVDKDFRPYLVFTHQKRYYQYRAMCFGMKHAPLTFHKTLRPVIRIIREQL